MNSTSCSLKQIPFVPLDEHGATAIREALEKRMMEIPEQLRLSLTYDQVKEISRHRLFTEETNIVVTFADPHSPWQRGTNENTNGLVRQIFPMGMDFTTVTAEQIHTDEFLMNTKPRETLGWRTPLDWFDELYHESEARFDLGVAARTNR